MKSNGKKVFVGVSGGVDSSVALALLKQQGYEVTGVFLKVWSPEWLPCDWKEERRSAMRVCATLGVPFMTLDCEVEYKKEVVDYMIREYSAGRVPNPDVFCNKFVKFGVFLRKALEMEADYVATGHYCRISVSPYSSQSTTYFPAGKLSRSRVFTHSESLCSEQEKPKSYQLLESVDKEKDQSYFLYTLGQNELSHTLFPVGGMTKPEVRHLAEKFCLPTATKKDSQGLCFIGKVDMKDFLAHYIPKNHGNVLNTAGEIIGYHDGAVLFAIGERHGFTITIKTPEEPRYFVVSKDVEKNMITVASRELENEEKYAVKEIVMTDLHFISGTEPVFPFKVGVRIRYHQEVQSGVLEKKSDGYHFVFDTPQNAISIGQSAVLYDGDVCLGGGVIEKCI